MVAEQKRKKTKKKSFFLVLNPRPGPDGPRASGWSWATPPADFAVLGYQL